MRHFRLHGHEAFPLEAKLIGERAVLEGGEVRRVGFVAVNVEVETFNGGRAALGRILLVPERKKPGTRFVSYGKERDHAVLLVEVELPLAQAQVIALDLEVEAEVAFRRTRHLRAQVVAPIG